jgi:hypothetical protein
VPSKAECVGEAKLSDKRAQLSVAIDKLYNAKYLNCHSSRVVPMKSNIDVACMPNNVGRHSNHFPVTDESRRFYHIFCALGRVGFDSLEQSIKPHGHCDQFFIAGYCRKFFEDSHPRISKKHYFYPKVGVLL